MSGIVQIRTDRIRPLSVQRDVYEPSKFRRLKKDIEVNGVMNPIHVILDKKHSKGRVKHYIVYIGTHRLQACIELEWKQISAYIHDLSEADAIARGYVDNDTQVEMNPMDTNKIIQYLNTEKKLPYKVIANKLRQSLSQVKQLGRLNHLPLPIQHRIRENAIPWSNASLLLKLKSPQKMIEACEEIIINRLTQKEILQKIREGSFGEEYRRIQGNPIRCFVCGDMSTYNVSRTRQICLGCLQDVKTGKINLKKRHRSPQEWDIVKQNIKRRQFWEHNCINCIEKDCHRCLQLRELLEIPESFYQNRRRPPSIDARQKSKVHSKKIQQFVAWREDKEEVNESTGNHYNGSSTEDIVKPRIPARRQTSKPKRKRTSSRPQKKRRKWRSR